MGVDAALLDRAGELKQALVEFAEHPQYGRAFTDLVARHVDRSTVLDERQVMTLTDHFVLQHRLRNGRTVLEQFLAAHRELSQQEREMVLNLVDDLTYEVYSNMGPSVFRQMPNRSFLITRLVPIGDTWMISGPAEVYRTDQRDVVLQAAANVAMGFPEAVYRNPDKLARAWDMQREDRQRFLRFFGTDLLVVPGDQVRPRMEEFHAFCHDQIERTQPKVAPHIPAPMAELPAEIVDSESVALIYDEDDGLGFYADFDLAEAAFADPDLIRRRRYRETVLAYLDDDTVEPMVLRRLAERDPAKATIVFRKLLKRPSFDWARHGEDLLRTSKVAYFDRPRRPRFSPISERLVPYVDGG
ncbi:hypothetical protein GCM10023317_21860 [Actinopolymorpha pittospori]